MKFLYEEAKFLYLGAKLLYLGGLLLRSYSRIFAKEKSHKAFVNEEQIDQSLKNSSMCYVWLWTRKF